MQELNLVQQIIILAPPILLAITLHEVAHGRAALRLGDTTARDYGRLSLNPLRHIDPIGTVLVPAALFFLGGFIFGWAKPVPVDFRRLRQPKRDMALVALAGPGANLVMAVLWAILAGFGFNNFENMPWLGEPLFYMGMIGIQINIVLAVLNLLPVPPLDGSRVLVGILPDAFGAMMARLEPFGLLILVALLATGLLGFILGPPVSWLREAVYFVFFS
jgi:Zn-dependent protease